MRGWSPFSRGTALRTMRTRSWSFFNRHGVVLFFDLGFPASTLLCNTNFCCFNSWRTVFYISVINQLIHHCQCNLQNCKSSSPNWITAQWDNVPGTSHFVTLCRSHTETSPQLFTSPRCTSTVHKSKELQDPKSNPVTYSPGIVQQRSTHKSGKASPDCGFTYNFTSLTRSTGNSEENNTSSQLYHMSMYLASGLPSHRKTCFLPLLFFCSYLSAPTFLKQNSIRAYRT